MSDHVVPRFRSSYKPKHCESRAKLHHYYRWSDPVIEKYLGEPDCTGFQGGDRFGAERILLASVGIPELYEDMPVELYNRFHGIDQLGFYWKHEGFPWLAVTGADNAEPDAVIALESQRLGVHYMKIKSVYASLGRIALIQGRQVDDPMSLSAE